MASAPPLLQAHDFEAAYSASRNSIKALHDIVPLIEEGRLHVPIWRTYPLTEAAAALDLSRSGHVGDKIVLLP